MSGDSRSEAMARWGRRLKLMQVLTAGTALPQYQRGYLGRVPVETHCSVFARDVLDSRAKIKWNPQGEDYGDIISEYDYDIRSINPGKSLMDVIVNTPIWDSSANVLAASKQTVMDETERARNVFVLEKARGPVEVTPPEAFVLAGDGVPVWVVGFKMFGTEHLYRHEAIVLPEGGVYNEDLGLMLAQAGGVNGFFRISDPMAFGRYWRDNEIHFFVFPKYEEEANV